jgi:hypothetical protein
MAHIDRSSGKPKIVLHTSIHDQNAAEELSEWIRKFDPNYKVGDGIIGPFEEEDDAQKVQAELNARSNHLQGRLEGTHPRLPQPIHEWMINRKLN